MIIFQLSLLTGLHCKEINLAVPQKHQVYLFTQICQFRKLQHQRSARWDGEKSQQHLCPSWQLVCQCGKTEGASDSWGKPWRLSEIRPMP